MSQPLNKIRGRAFVFGISMGPSEYIVGFLIAEGADVNATNNAGETALQVAERAKRTEVLELLQPSVKIMSKLMKRRAPPSSNWATRISKGGH